VAIIATMSIILKMVNPPLVQLEKMVAGRLFRSPLATVHQPG
jgi:hypothetical protein